MYRTIIAPLVAAVVLMGDGVTTELPVEIVRDDPAVIEPLDPATLPEPVEATAPQEFAP